jgi:hypothetical protein
MSNGWKVEEVDYDFDIDGFLRLRLVWDQKCRFSDCSVLPGTEFQQPGRSSKFRNS